MDFSSVKAITIPEGVVKKIAVGASVIWEEPSSYKNWVFFSTESDGKTIYNSGKGYKDGYRVRSGGTEASFGQSTITGYIPFRKGDKMYIYPPFANENSGNAINFYDSTFTNLGQRTDSGANYGICNNSFATKVINGVSVLDLSAVTVSGVENIAYVRVTNLIQNINNYVAVISSGAEMIITVNEEIT